jgi:hypothetical protein
LEEASARLMVSGQPELAYEVQALATLGVRWGERLTLASLMIGGVSRPASSADQRVARATDHLLSSMESRLSRELTHMRSRTLAVTSRVEATDLEPEERKQLLVWTSLQLSCTQTLAEQLRASRDRRWGRDPSGLSAF